MARTIRVALVQLDVHLALHVGEISLLDEPFGPASRAASLRGMRDLGIDVGDVQEQIRSEYTLWLSRRVQAIVDYLKRSCDALDLVLFPEGAIPPQVFGELTSLTDELGATVFAGSHTPSQLRAVRPFYDAGRIPWEKVTKAVSRTATKNALAIIGPTASRLIPKVLPSVFENTGLRADPGNAVKMYRPFDMVLSCGADIAVLPLVCSEALQLYNVDRRYDVAAVVSCEAKPERFLDAFSVAKTNRVLPVYCNVAQFGGSGVFPVFDRRQPNWYDENFPAGLPAEPTVLVVEVDLDALAPQVGTAVPAVPVLLKRLASIVGDQETAAEASKGLSAAAKLRTPEERHEALRRLAAKPLRQAQQVRIAYLSDLEERGLASAPEWAALGEDCLVSHQGGLPALEAALSSIAAARLVDAFQRGSVSDPAGLAALQAYLRACEARRQAYAGERTQTEGVLEGREGATTRRAGLAAAVFDRDEEAQRVVEFLDDRHVAVLEVYGLPQIGKSTVVKKGIDTSGRSLGRWISLKRGTSPEYLLSAILSRGAYGAVRQLDAGISEELAAEVRASLARDRVVVIEGLDEVTEHGAWTSPLFDELLGLLGSAAVEVRAKLILETSRRLPFEALDPVIKGRLAVYGLDRKKVSYGTSLLDAHLRRCDLETDFIASADKEKIVGRLGGHPMAIALAADVLADEGPEALAGPLRARRGGALAGLRKLVDSIALDEAEREILSLAALARAPVPRAVVLAAARSTDASAALASVVGAGCLELRAQARVEIAGLIAEFFEPTELAASQRETFHRMASEQYGAAARAGNDLIDAVEAEFHARIIGEQPRIRTGLLDAGLAAAQRLYEEQRFDEAISLVNAALAERTSHQALRLAALIEAKRGNFDIARIHAREVFHKNPGDKWLLIQLAKDALTQCQDDEVAQIIEIARRARVEDDSLLVVEGRVLLRRGRLSEAREVFGRASDITEHNGWPFFYLGRTNYMLGDVDSALDAYLEGERFVESQFRQNRDLLSALRTQLANLYVLEGNLEAAEQILKLLLEDDPNNPEVIMAYAAWTIETRGEQQAYKALEELGRAKIKGAFQKSRFHLFYAQFYSRIGDERRANDHFRLAFRADQTNVYVMQRWAQSAFDAALRLYLDADESYITFMEECARLAKRILVFDAKNERALSLLVRLREKMNYGR